LQEKAIYISPVNGYTQYTSYNGHLIPNPVYVTMTELGIKYPLVYLQVYRGPPLLHSF